MADPVVLVRARGGRTERLDAGAGEWRRVAGDALGLIGEYMSTHRRDPVPGLPPFQGGAAGFLSYEWGRSLEPRLPEPQFDDLDLPDVLLGVYDWVVAWDHVEARVWLVSTGLPETSPEACARRAAARAASVRGLLGAGEAGSRSADARSDRSSGVEPVRTYPVEANDWSKRVASDPPSRTRAIWRL
jgi:para-aminobenzoate synthetase component 1